MNTPEMVQEPVSMRVDRVAAKARPRTLRQRTLMWLRRGHLYVGLFMIPWVLVYAVSGFLLNHETVWSGGTAHQILPEHLVGTGLDTLNAVDIAKEVTDVLNNRAGHVAYRLSEPSQAKFEAEYIPIHVTFHGKSTRLNLDLATRSGRYTMVDTAVASASGVADPSKAAFATEGGVFGKERLADRVRTGANAMFTRAGTPPEKCELSWAPGVAFILRDEEGRSWKARYDPEKGGVTGSPVDAVGAEKGFKEFLFNLHFSAGYPPSIRLRWIWAIFVDLTVGSLLFWCVSGLFMWWQIKAVRNAGIVVLVSSVLTAAVLGIAMHGVFGS